MKKTVSLFLCVMFVFSLCACTKKASDIKIDLSSVMAEINEKIDLPENDMMKVSSTDKLMDYYGIKAEDVASFEIQMNSSGVEQDEIVLIETTSEEACQRVEQALKARLDDKTTQMKNYNPEQYEILSNCSVSVSGLYVRLFISKDADKIEEIFKSYLN